MTNFGKVEATILNNFVMFFIVHRRRCNNFGSVEDAIGSVVDHGRPISKFGWTFKLFWDFPARMGILTHISLARPTFAIFLIDKS